MVAEQMICIITPPQRLVAARLRRAQGGLTALFTRVGHVHFASIALLPPCAGVAASQAPTLMLELAVDDGWQPADLIAFLVQEGFEKLWFLYGAFWNGGRRASELVRRDWLQTFLLEHTSRADGGFIGARDRSVARVLSEAKLFEAARAEVYRRFSPDVDDRSSLARSVAEWAASEAQFRWAVEPAPRSFWRAPCMTPVVRPLFVLARLGFPLLSLIVTALVATAGVGTMGLSVVIAVLDPRSVLQTPAIFGSHFRFAICAVAVATIMLLLIVFIASLAVTGLRSLAVAAFLLIALGFSLLVAAIGMYFHLGHTDFFSLLGALEVLVRAGVLAMLWTVFVWAALSVAFLFALLTSRPFMGLPAVLAAFVALGLLGAWISHAALATVVAWGASMQLGIYPSLHQSEVFGLAAIDAIALLIFVLFSGIAFLLVRWVGIPPFAEQRRSRPMDTLKTYELHAGHQVHKSIEESEARLAAGHRPNHMISLTDIRQPYWLNRCILRNVLWLITLIGHTAFTRGRLFNAEGIRFAHWHVIDGGRRLLFFSNYDGSFGGYLDDFINGASEGINMIWRWTQLSERPAAMEAHPSVKRMRSFPPTRLGIFGGCKYEQWFKAYARDSMLPHIFRFEAYTYSALDVERATRLREALFGLRNTVKDDQMMRALES